MKPVTGFGKCSTVNDQFIWNEEDSTEGIDVPAWKQTAHEVDCSDEDCAEYCKQNFEGAFVNGVNKHICYSYETLDSICIVIKYDKLRDEYVFHGGCYPGNETYKMSPATFGIWLRDLSLVRNLCAHNQRLWKRNFIFCNEKPDIKQLIDKLIQFLNNEPYKKPNEKFLEKLQARLDSLLE